MPASIAAIVELPARAPPGRGTVGLRRRGTFRTRFRARPRVPN